MANHVVEDQIFWIDEFKKASALRVPFLSKQSNCIKKELFNLLELNHNKIISTLQINPDFKKYSNDNLLFGLVCAYFLRIQRENFISFKYSDSELQKKVAGAESIFAAFVPITLQIDANASFSEVLANIENEKKRLISAGVYRHDLPLNVPEIYEKCCSLTVSLSIQDTEDFVLDETSHLNIVLNFNQGKTFFYLSKDADDVYFRQFVAAIEIHLKELSDLIAASPQTSLVKFPWAFSEKQKKSLLQYSGTDALSTTFFSLCDIFNKIVKKRPSAVALIDRGTSYTYAQLDEFSNKIANILLHQGVGLDEIVGVHLDKGFALYCAIWGILKAGAAFYLISPEFPAIYKLKLLSFANIKIILGEDKYGLELKRLDNTTYIDIKNLPEINDHFSKPDIKSTMLAYLIYTSGTTGDPKGALIKHEGIANTVLNFVEIFDVSHDSRILSVSALNFDAFMLEMMMTVSAGATLLFEDNEKCVPGEQLSKTLRDHQIHFAILTPTALRLTPADFLPHLKTILSAGEACHPDLYSKWSFVPSFFNVYGPSETSAVVTYYKCHHTDQWYFPIGRPLPNVLIYILDENMQPVPWGVTGDIYIGGVAVAREYLNAEQTKQSFLLNPFLGSKMGKLYRTGDIGRWLLDGNIKFLGRGDTQIKIRGCRIELGEIENVLHQFPEIANVVVEREASGHHLIAYYTIKNKKVQVSVDALKLFLLQRLPSYMLPHKYIEVENVPLLPSGKINRKALAAWREPEAVTVSQNKLLDIESKLLEIWSEVFKRRDFNVNSDFFSLGGTSIQILQIICHGKKYHLSITFEDIYLHSTIERLAQKILENNIPEKHIHPLIQECEEDEKSYPLTPVQSGILFCYLHKKNINIYLVQTTLRINAALDVPKYKAAWEMLVQRHDILRTYFKWAKLDSLIQLVHQTVSLPFSYIDLRYLSPGCRDVELAAVIKEDKNISFDLNSAPLMRIKLIHLEDECFQLVWTFHHIILDAYSYRILLNDLEKIYSMLVKNEKVTLPKPNSFFDFNVQQKYITSLEENHFWKSYLQDANFFFKPDFLYPVGMRAAENDMFLEKRYDFSNELKVNIQKFLSHKKISFTAFFQLSWALLLKTFSHTREITFGFTVSSRLSGMNGFDKTAGPLINTVPIRVSFNEKTTISGSLSKIQSNMYDIYKMGQHLSLNDIRKICGVGGKGELFDTLLEVTDMDFYFENDLKKSLFNYSDYNDWTLLQYPLTILGNMGSDFHIRILYNTGRIKSTFVRNIPSYLEKIFKTVIDDSNQSVENMNILTDFESNLLFDKWQGPIKNIPERSLIALFEDQVKINPEKVALIFRDEKITYSLLNKRANQLASYISNCGAVEKSNVVVFLDRSLESIISCLAILKTGSIYIPVDPQLPQARVKAMLDGLNISVVITNYHLGVKLKEKEIIARYVALDNEWFKIFRENHTDLNVYTSTNDPFCIIYTSGSTGRPKGVLMKQKTILNLFVWQTQCLDFSHISRLTQFMNLGFDVSLFEIFTGLLGGKEIHLIPSDIKRSPVQLVNYILENKINQIFLPTALLNYFVDEAIKRQIKFPYLREILVAGEALKINTATKKFFILNNHISLINCYGPTEGHIVAAYKLAKNPGAWQTSTPIGRLLPNVKIYLLDEKLKPVPLGVKGELFIGGDVLASGYYGLEALTKEKFLPDPFSDDKDAVMYQTGDIVEWDITGVLLFHGRTDDQIKIQGYRVELSEIETLLLRHPAVKKCAVILNAQANIKRIVAYIVTYPEMREVHDGFQRYLSGLLPLYMLPAAYVFLDEFPLNKNGKVDKRMLPSPLDEHYTRQCTYVPPRNEIEIVLSYIWSKILGIQSMGIHDDFFELGGNSLSAIQLQSNIYKYFLVDVSIEDLLNATTIAEFSGIIKQIATDHYVKNNLLLIKYQNRHIPASAIKLQEQGTKPPLFLIHPIGGTAFGFVHLVKYLDKSQPCYAIQDPGIETGDVLFDTLEQMAEFYVETIIRVYPQGPYFLVGASMGATLVVAMLSLFKKRNKIVSFAGLLDGWAKYPAEIQEEQFVRSVVSKHLDKINFKAEDENSVQWIDLQLHRSQLLWDYQTPIIDSQIILFKADQLLSVFRNTDHPYNYWSEFCTKPVTVYYAPGDHETMFDKVNAPKLASLLNLAIAKSNDCVQETFETALLLSEE